jgi:hypothetical protein
MNAIVRHNGGESPAGTETAVSIGNKRKGTQLKRKCPATFLFPLPSPRFWFNKPVDATDRPLTRSLK